MFGRGSETRSARLNLRRALLIEPIQAIQGSQFASE